MKSKIEQVVGSYLNLKKNGADMLESMCPFHKDNKTKSLKVWPAQELFECRHCSLKGDAAFFVSQYEKISLEEARKLI